MYRLLLIALIAALSFCSPSTHRKLKTRSRSKTRVVFLDALVKDKKTNLPISNLTPENFEVLDDGKPRTSPTSRAKVRLASRSR